MSGSLIFTCDVCKSIVDYHCRCERQRIVKDYKGHSSVAEAKIYVTNLTTNQKTVRL